ncbi:MAG: hypothetical protein K6A05_03125 [Lachnospiraceae bacterium]|nr:hypothetical protein [Lachnospiraceae bacterium]
MILQSALGCGRKRQEIVAGIASMIAGGQRESSLLGRKKLKEEGRIASKSALRRSIE